VKARLDAKTVAAVSLSKAGAAEEFIWDAELEGFALRLRRRVNGEPLRNYIVQYRANGHTRRAKIGAVGTITPAEARDAARTILAKVQLGGDPQGEKAAKRQQATHTVRSVVTTYLEAKAPDLRPESMRIAKLYLEGSYFKRLHPMAIGAVTRADVASCIRAIASGHSGPTAAACRRALSAFFSWAIADGLLGNGANPVDGSHRPDDPAPREHTPTGPELAAIWNACDGAGDFDKIIRLLILLGSRRAEVGGMCWSELDLNAGTWTLPGLRSKNHRGYTVMLPPAALAIIESVPRTSRDNLFGDRASSGFTPWGKAKGALDRRLGQTVRPWNIHDLRRGIATGMADDLGIEPHHIEAVLNHWSGSRSGIAQVYNRATYTTAIAAALNRWAEHILALAEGRQSNILTLQRA
jgi:integrase